MNGEMIVRRVARLSFRQAVWFFPLAFALHVREEVSQFTNWARTYASPQFTFRRMSIRGSKSTRSK